MKEVYICCRNDFINVLNQSGVVYFCIPKSNILNNPLLIDKIFDKVKELQKHYKIIFI